ncbi:PTS system fructose-specific transporter subunits IIBC [Citrobacter koseri]|uniref:PTS system fructose-specific transporter subunits IIBC n=1 Tax=Citrobacter koseri TaxID=545 RepID=A0A2X2VTN7_CITKO|nr:PTS system fructose-specific transporter subunits IIBC [Citrobacter koseri]
MCLADAVPNDSALNGKKVWLGDIARAVAHPELFLNEAKGHATPYSAPTAVAAPAAASGPKRVVAVTACPTGVAHTFMAAEAIETEAKKRGWWVKVETRGSVGAGNAITPEEVAEADLVIVAADIEVDLAKFAGKPMYRTSTGLALKKTAQELDKAVAEATPYAPTGKAQAAATEGKKRERWRISPSADGRFLPCCQCGCRWVVYRAPPLRLVLRRLKKKVRWLRR